MHYSNHNIIICGVPQGSILGLLYQGCQLSRNERESHTWTLLLTPSMKISHINAKTSCYICKISRSKEKVDINFFFLFACHLMQQELQNTIFHLCGFSCQAILKSWQPCSNTHILNDIVNNPSLLKLILFADGTVMVTVIFPWDI